MGNGFPLELSSISFGRVEAIHQKSIYLDHQATTPLASEALEAMLPFFQEHFANAGSVTHCDGEYVRQQVDMALASIAASIGAQADELVITSGATESNNLALFGSCLHPRQKRRKIVSLASEHKAVLDPLAKLAKLGFEVTLLPIQKQDSACPGLVDLERVENALDDDTCLLTVMLANNEIGVIQPLAEIAKMCRHRNVLLHTDASQAVGQIPVDVDRLDVDLMSFSAHKFYGPKGVGGLYVRNRDRRIRLSPQIVGGGQQHNMRSGTLNTPGIIGMQAALRYCCSDLHQAMRELSGLRNRLFRRLDESLDTLSLNGPSLSVEADETSPLCRLPGNLNCSFYPIEGQSLMLACSRLAVSSGSACTSAEPSSSHVLAALGLSEERSRSSLRFGIGRQTTTEEVDQAADWLIEAVEKLRKLL